MLVSVCDARHLQPPARSIDIIPHSIGPIEAKIHRLIDRISRRQPPFLKHPPSDISVKVKRLPQR